jgi:hypothetical protein
VSAFDLTKPKPGLAQRLLRSTGVRKRTDLGGLPVYDARPRGIQWPAIAKPANTLRRSVIVPIFPLAREHIHGEVFPFLRQAHRRTLEVRDPADRQDFWSTQAQETVDVMIRQPALAGRPRD